MRRSLVLAGLALLAACGDWPDLGLDDEVTGYPRLVPFDEVAAPGAMAETEAAEAAEADAQLIARAEALRARAAGLGLSEEDRDALDGLRLRPAPGGG
jgi:hypothetical protein